MPEDPLAQRYRFDGFELDTAERLLYRDGQPVGLGARAIALLTALLGRPGRLLTKAELLDRVWPGLVVEENNLQVQVSALRKVLGAHMIVTVPGRGYRFVQPVQPVQPDRPTTDATRAAPPPAKPPRAWHTHTAADALSVLPAQTACLWGREGDLAALDACLPAPLITVVGPSGMGKTALALAAAHRWQADRPDGSTWIDLSALQGPDQVGALVAQGLGLAMSSEQGPAALVDALRPLKVLIVLDNAEQVRAAVAELAAAILTGAPGVRLLVTSQVPLKVAGERVFRLGPLAVPPPEASPQEALAHGALELLVDQVRSVDRHFELQPTEISQATQLCRRLDGLPLAIKLAAARVPLLGLSGVLERLDERFELLAQRQVGTPDRHQTLQAALDWSHGLLEPPEQAMFRRLAVFAGSFPLALVPILGQPGPAGEALDEWRVLDTLGTLADRSLVVVEGGEHPRYRLLDSVREHALLKLEASGEQAGLQRHHALAVADLLDMAYDTHWSSSDVDWLGRHAADIDNVRLALEWSTVHAPALGVRILGAAGPLFMLLGLAPEARRRSERLLDSASALGGAPEATRLWLEGSRLHWGIDNALMLAWSRRATDGARQSRDARGVFLGLHCQACSGLLNAEQAQQALREMARLESSAWPARLLSQRLLAEVGVLRAHERMADARRTCQGLIVQAQAAGLDGVLSAALSDLAAICLALGDTDGAWRVSQQILARSRRRRDNFVVHALATVACVAFVRADLAQARASLLEFTAASRSRSWEWFGPYSALLALLAVQDGRMEAAARLLGYVEQQRSQWGRSDVLGVYARTRARAAVADALEPSVLRSLSELGSRLEPEEVCAWAFGAPAGPMPSNPHDHRF